MSTAKQTTFLFHDYETFGKSPSLDRPAQFAGVRTDMDFNIIGEPEVFYCRPADDYLPQPEAVMITGITPQLAQEKGINEATFAARIDRLFTQPGTCVVGYNNVRFDDEVTRHLFYRNFYDPYAWSWQNGNSRWDVLDVMRACCALRPEGIVWPENNEGFTSFRLEHLTKANGVAHEQAHDAMSDVYATIAMAKRVKTAQPRLYDFLFSHRHKQKIAALVDIPQMTPLLHISGMFGAARGNASLIAPLAWHPLNKNALIVCDLAGDITPLHKLDVAALRERLYTRRDALNGATPLPLKLVHINKCPVVAPHNTLRPQDAERLGISRENCLATLAELRSNTTIREKVVEIFAGSESFTAPDDVDAQLYSGFFSDADRAAMRIIQQTAAKNLPALDLTFSDARLNALLFRYRARNFPGTLDDAEQQRWLVHRREMLNPTRLTNFISELEQLAIQHASDKVKISQLNALFAYAQTLAS